jgi:hypothetical protein
MPLFLCCQSLCIYCLEVLLKLGWNDTCLSWEDRLIGLLLLVARRKRKSRIKNVVPGPRSGLGSFVVEHCRLLWLYDVGADQAINVHHW